MGWPQFELGNFLLCSSRISCFPPAALTLLCFNYLFTGLPHMQTLSLLRARAGSGAIGPQLVLNIFLLAEWFMNWKRSNGGAWMQRAPCTGKAETKGYYVDTGTLHFSQQLLCDVIQMSVTYIVLLSKVLNQNHLMNPHKNLPRRQESRIHFFVA